MNTYMSYVLVIQFLIHLCAVSQKGDHRVKHVSFRNITTFGQIWRLTQLYLCF